MELGPRLCYASNFQKLLTDLQDKYLKKSRLIMPNVYDFDLQVKYLAKILGNNYNDCESRIVSENYSKLCRIR